MILSSDIPMLGIFSVYRVDNLIVANAIRKQHEQDQLLFLRCSMGAEPHFWYLHG